LDAGATKGSDPNVAPEADPPVDIAAGDKRV
jgi:hypothetical protein